MPKLEITYNPYAPYTSIRVEGRKVPEDSPLNFGQLRLQEWAPVLGPRLVGEIRAREFDITFRGTLQDYDDLRAALAADPEIAVRLTHIVCAGADEAEQSIKDIYAELQNGPIPELRDDKIREDFQRALNQEFEVNVIATMSAGKSTLINALLGRKLMPSANKATTAVIVRITDNDMPVFTGKAFDADGDVLLSSQNVDASVMKQWNEDPQVREVHLEGAIPFLRAAGTRLVLTDTPGPNNARDPKHRQRTYDMLKESDHSMVLLVMDATSTGTDDEKNLMDFVSRSMNEHGRQGRDRYIFALNKLDSYNPDDNEDIERDALKPKIASLAVYGIHEPNLFPVATGPALETRDKPRIPMYGNFAILAREFPQMRLDAYGAYTHLPRPVLERIESRLAKADEEQSLLIHTGLVGIEEAIALYINKYARAMKVRDLADAFRFRLRELRVFEELNAKIQNDEKTREALRRSVEAARSAQAKGDTMRRLRQMIDSIDFSSDVNDSVTEAIDDAMRQINDIAANADTQVPSRTAVRQARRLIARSRDIVSSLSGRASGILERGRKKMMADITRKFAGVLDDFDIKLPQMQIDLRLPDLVQIDADRIYDVIDANTDERVDGHHTEYHTEREEYQVKKEPEFWHPSTWKNLWQDNYETRCREKLVSRQVEDTSEYVDMQSVADKLLDPLLKKLSKARRDIGPQVKKQTEAVRRAAGDYALVLDKNIKQTLSKLEALTKKSKQTEAEAARSREQLEWLGRIEGRVDALINWTDTEEQ